MDVMKEGAATAVFNGNEMRAMEEERGGKIDCISLFLREKGRSRGQVRWGFRAKGKQKCRAKIRINCVEFMKWLSP